MLDEELDRCGRTREGMDLSVRVNLKVADETSDSPCVGPPAKIVDSIGRFEEAGLTHLQLATPPGPETRDILRQMELFTTTIRPEVT